MTNERWICICGTIGRPVSDEAEYKLTSLRHAQGCASAMRELQAGRMPIRPYIGHHEDGAL